jgi:exosome complex component RRP4
VIFVEDKEIVIPGDILADEEYHSGRGTFKENDKVCSSLVGLVAIRDKKISVIPLQSKYIPKRGDVVIGEVTDIRFLTPDFYQLQMFLEKKKGNLTELLMSVMYYF